MRGENGMDYRWDDVAGYGLIALGILILIWLT
jgi:hypothetical protein